MMAIKDMHHTYTIFSHNIPHPYTVFIHKAVWVSGLTQNFPQVTLCETTRNKLDSLTTHLVKRRTCDHIDEVLLKMRKEKK